MRHAGTETRADRLEHSRRAADKERPIQWEVFVGTKRQLIWKVGPVFTLDGGRDGRTEYESLDDAVASLRAKAS
jgi:hypothetical protein